MKELSWVGSALQDLRAFPRDVRRIAGHQLHLVQMGLEPHDWKPMPTIGPGACELRIHAGGEHRVFYSARFPDGVFVLHAFRKKTPKTTRRDIEIARQRLREVTRLRVGSRRKGQ